VTQPNDFDDELIKTPRLELCSGCRRIKYCVQFVKPRFAWMLADTPEHEVICRCEFCTRLQGDGLARN